MTDWTESKWLPDGPDGEVVTRSWVGTNDHGDRLYLCLMVPEDLQRNRYATLGVIGRLPTDEEAAEAIELLDFQKATWRIGQSGLGLFIELTD